ncbi:MAG: membrane protein implicated in regulation of membrane protease activity [Solidesulfovibrio magneticus str. Maddingley MBC34]|uniref:Membrane protein implicated in regulation of membrane protease activity n=1 Tax=Solidesulfovibrio magneticus str. Maddingley MBC34 TaxID=1206767 RepID=K6GG60_9BACT|nr:MAG: membrane protein implicated in regulation of membrane protease activity [Solidesulfovibrio magneticus str. Maddingley MBC34]
MTTSFPPWLIWFVIGLAVSLSELLIPGFVIIFFGLGCLGAAVLAAVLPDAYTAQVATFIVVTILSLTTLRKMAMRVFVGKSEAAPGDERDRNFVTARVLIEHELAPGQETQVRYRGSVWRARAAEHLAADTEVAIAGFDHADKSCLILKVLKPS